MRVNYIKHSGFSVELESLILIFDYYDGKLPEFPDNKPLYIFASHNHHDHFNPFIFNLGKGRDNVFFILSSDIDIESVFSKNLDKKSFENKITIVSHDFNINVGDINITTLKSTDKGVAFLVKAEDKSIYHAGDLNCWIWADESEVYNLNMAKDYKREVDKLIKEDLDIAFLPLDPRLEESAFLGFEYFIDKIKVKDVFPMHFWEDHEIIFKFKEKNTKAKAFKGHIHNIFHANQTFDI